MSYVALYRKFRPQTFRQIKGQDHVVQALQNQLKKNRIGHAYLFTGTRGTGKTSAAKIFAKAVNCLNPVEGEPCNECENCRAINAGNFVDVVEVDAASNNGVDDIRRIIEEVRYTPVKGTYKVYIIDEAHMITGPAFNAFLKTLEEPPAYAVFILATTEPHKLPVTILSRCQRYDFHRITQDKLTENLSEIVRQEGVEAEEKALRYIARIGDGSMRDSISLLDKCIAFNLGGKLTYENVLDTLGTVDIEVFSRLFRTVSRGEAANALYLIDEAVSTGRDLTQFTADFIWYLRNLLLVNAARLRDPEILGVSAENMEQLVQDASAAEGPELIRYIRILSELLNQIRFSTTKQVILETGIIRLAVPEMETDVRSLQDRIRQLENRMDQGFVPKQVQIRTEQTPPAASPSTSPETDPGEEDAFFAGLGLGRMTNPDAFADLLEDPEPVPEIRQEKPAAAAADQPQGDLVNLWPGIVASCANPRIRITLNKCTIRQVGDSVIRILAPGEFQLNQLKEEAVLNDLKQIAGQAAGKAVELQMALAGSSQDEADRQTKFPDELLNNINFNIGTEEW